MKQKNVWRVKNGGENDPWCNAVDIPEKMSYFENHVLFPNTPFSSQWPRQEVIERLTETHGELAIIRPFQSGNQLFNILLGNILLQQAGYAPILSNVYLEQKEMYQHALHIFWQTGNLENAWYLVFWSNSKNDSK